MSETPTQTGDDEQRRNNDDETTELNGHELERRLDVTGKWRLRCQICGESRVRRDFFEEIRCPKTRLVDARGTRLVTDGGTTTKPRFEPGDEVLDGDADSPNTAIVIALPEEPAYARTIPALDGDPSVADVNPDYPASGSVATVAYAGDLDRALDVWRDAAPDALAEICEDFDVRTYDFVTARLQEADR